MDRMEKKLDALWSGYRDACGDPEPSAEFMPTLWRRIDAQRSVTTSIFRRLVQVCVVAAVALTLLMAVVIIPRIQRMPVYSANYVDVLAEEQANDYADVLAGGDLR
jgi:hypothetical protein